MIDRRTAWALRRATETGGTVPTGPDFAAEAERARSLLAEWARLDVLVNACPDRGCRTGCGNAECKAGKGDQAGGSIASIVHCRQCVTDSAGPP